MLASHDCLGFFPNPSNTRLKRELQVAWLTGSQGSQVSKIIVLCLPSFSVPTTWPSQVFSATPRNRGIWNPMFLACFWKQYNFGLAKSCNLELTFTTQNCQTVKWVVFFLLYPCLYTGTMPIHGKSAHATLPTQQKSTLLPRVPMQAYTDCEISGRQPTRIYKEFPRIHNAGHSKKTDAQVSSLYSSMESSKRNFPKLFSLHSCFFCRLNYGCLKPSSAVLKIHLCLCLCFFLLLGM